MIGFRNPYIMGSDTEPLDAKIRNLESIRGEGDREGLAD